MSTSTIVGSSLRPALHSGAWTDMASRSLVYRCPQQSTSSWAAAPRTHAHWRPSRKGIRVAFALFNKCKSQCCSPPKPAASDILGTTFTTRLPALHNVHASHDLRNAPQFADSCSLTHVILARRTFVRLLAHHHQQHIHTEYAFSLIRPAPCPSVGSAADSGGISKATCVARTAFIRGHGYHMDRYLTNMLNCTQFGKFVRLSSHIAKMRQSH
jgi:hypothetical protein